MRWLMYPHPSTLVPHRGPALFLTRIVAAEPGSIRCEAVLPEEAPGARHEGVVAAMGIELLGQGVAALRGLGAVSDKPGVGYVVSVRRASFAAPFLPVQEPLRIQAQEVARQGALVEYEGFVSLGERELMRASFLVLARQREHASLAQESSL